MRFQHCGVHHREFSALVNGAYLEQRPTGFPIVIGCRICHQWYFADHAPVYPSPELVHVLSTAERRLSQECPDHPHRFDLGAAVGR